MTGPSVTADPAAAALHTYYSPPESHQHLPSTELSTNQDSNPLAQHDVHQLSPPALLAFSDISSQLSQLGIPSSPEGQPDSSPPSHSILSLGRSNSTHRPRKPSPGLAARLKALGFGGAARQTSPPPPLPSDRVGRLPEDQIRLIDQKHLANSVSAETVERRGRPWKGASAPLQLLRSKSSRTSLGGKKKAAQDDIIEEEEPLPKRPELLPEITATPPLEMDTHKYRLPDHTNGNGTKALSDTRREHIERDFRTEEQENQAPPPPLPKDTPPGGTTPSEFTPNAASYFNPLGLQRAPSIYTISRLSFANQLAQLTSLQLPDAESLPGKISAIPTAQAAAKALINAAEQIKMWISKAAEVISGLDSDGDVEWAAAGGREGYEEVEAAITRFEELINVYVGAIEELQSRADIAYVPSEDLQQAVTQMEVILDEWAGIRSTLRMAKGQIEIAMEWEELWNSVLGEIQNEMDELCQLVFEMEERRHKSLLAVANGENVDIGELETIVEESPAPAVRISRMSLPAIPLTPTSPAGPSPVQDDSNLLALFARMQPLRASLDFLPMRISVFEARADDAFPSACEELQERCTSLEESYKKLEKDAEVLRKELGEDKWVLVFRGAGRQAQKMYESVERSAAKLREAVDSGMQLTNPAVMGKKIESYEAKKTHYGPAIERVLSIIDKGVKDRLTVNGEILRLHGEIQSRWEGIKGEMRELDAVLEEIQLDKGTQALRDSVSSMLSNDRSTIGSGHDTPGSSPPSSVVMSSLGLDPVTPLAKKTRSVSAGSHLPQPSNPRRSGLIPPSQQSRRPLGSRMSTISNSSTLSVPSRSSTATPVASRLTRSVSQQPDNRPRWNVSVSTRESDIGHNFKPLNLTTPSPYSKRSPTPVRSVSSITPGSQSSKIPTLRSPSRAGSVSPMLQDTPSRTTTTSRLSFRERISSPGPYAQQTLAKPRLSTQASMSALNNRRSSLQPPRLGQDSDPAARRPASSMAATRRTSMLPQPRAKVESVTGRDSPQALAGARTAMRKASSGAGKDMKDNKPRWHF
ncbi:cortical protein KAR9-domain-containing protein [Xylariales sp. PMI_506]|nr:cortical protein KAR9-domain-containing protein [Xylariales sp. PMI_506]